METRQQRSSFRRKPKVTLEANIQMEWNRVKQERITVWECWFCHHSKTGYAAKRFKESELIDITEESGFLKKLKMSQRKWCWQDIYCKKNSEESSVPWQHGWATSHSDHVGDLEWAQASTCSRSSCGHLGGVNQQMQRLSHILSLSP